MEVSVKKPGSPAELVHAGVKGMKWGVRKEPQRITPRQATKTGGQAARTKYREERAAGSGHFRAREAAKREKVAVARSVHKEARAANPNVAASRAFRQNFPTSKSKANEIRRARAQSNLDFTNYVNAKGSERERLKQVYLNNPDRATALRSTRGEKVVDGILLGTAGGLTATGLALGGPTAVLPAATGTAFVASLLGVTATRRHIERKQARGGYG